MGGTELLPYLLFAGGTALDMQASQEAEQEQKRILNRSMQSNQEATDQTASDVVKEAENYTPEQRALDMQAQENAAFQQAQADAGGAMLPTSSTGRTSADFQTGKAAVGAGEGNRITEIAREVARTRAPMRQRSDEAIRRGQLAQRISSIMGTNQNMARASQLDAQNVDAPWYGDLGQMAKIAGSVMMMGADGGAGATNTGGTVGSGSTGADGAFLGDTASGVPAWDAAMTSAPSLAFGSGSTNAGYGPQGMSLLNRRKAKQPSVWGSR
jgi:hypothetical protein